MEFLSDFFGRIFQVNRPAEPRASVDRKPIIQVVGMEFYNRQQSKLLLWVEPDCLEIDLNSATEYRIEFDGTEHRFEFDTDAIVLYLQSINTVLRIYERPYSNTIGTPILWTLTADYSD